MSNLLFKLYIRKRFFISGIARTTLRRSAIRNLYIQSTTLGNCLVSSLLQGIHTLCQIRNLCTNCCQLTRKLFILFCCVYLLLIHHRKLHTRIRKARNHVLALLLQKTHVRAHATKNLLHATALLAQISNKKTLLLKKRLKFFKLTVFLARAILRKLNSSLCLFSTSLQLAMRKLQLTKIIHCKLNGQILELGGQIFCARSLIYLPLKRFKLAGNLARNHFGSREILIHRRDFALRTLFAATMLGDICSLFNELTTLLRTARQNRVKLALGNDGVRIFAQARIMQDVLNVHEP